MLETPVNVTEKSFKVLEQALLLGEPTSCAGKMH